MDLEALPIRTAPSDVLLEIEMSDIFGQRYAVRGRFRNDAYHHGYLHIGEYYGWALYGGEDWRPCYKRLWFQDGKRGTYVVLQDDQVLAWRRIEEAS